MNVINVVIVSNETQYKVKVKNMITGDDMAIVGYLKKRQKSGLRAMFRMLLFVPQTAQRLMPIRSNLSRTFNIKTPARQLFL